MNDKICPKEQIDKIATELNAGNRSEAVNLINVCTTFIEISGQDCR